MINSIISICFLSFICLQRTFKSHVTSFYTSVIINLLNVAFSFHRFAKLVWKPIVFKRPRWKYTCFKNGWLETHLFKRAKLNVQSGVLKKVFSESCFNPDLVSWRVSVIQKCLELCSAAGSSPHTENQAPRKWHLRTVICVSPWLQGKWLKH